MMTEEVGVVVAITMTMTRMMMVVPTRRRRQYRPAAGQLVVKRSRGLLKAQIKYNRSVVRLGASLQGLCPGIIRDINLRCGAAISYVNCDVIKLLLHMPSFYVCVS